MKKRDSHEFPEKFKFASDGQVAVETPAAPAKKSAGAGGFLGDTIDTPKAPAKVEPKETVVPAVKLVPAKKVAPKLVKPPVVKMVKPIKAADAPKVKKSGKLKMPKFRSNRRRRIWMKENGLDPDAEGSNNNELPETVVVKKKVEVKPVVVKEPTVKKPESLPKVSVERGGAPRVFRSTSASLQNLKLLGKGDGKVYFDYDIPGGHDVKVTLFRGAKSFGPRDNVDAVRMAWILIRRSDQKEVKRGDVKLSGQGVFEFKTMVR